MCAYEMLVFPSCQPVSLRTRTARILAPACSTCRTLMQVWQDIRWPAMLRIVERLGGFARRRWCRTRVSLPRHTPCSAHPCQCRRQVKHGSCATYKKRILSAHEVRWRRFCLPLAGLFGVALRRVTVLSVCLRPACTEGSDPALLPPVGIKPNTALATAHQRRHIKRRVFRRLPAAMI